MHNDSRIDLFFPTYSRSFVDIGSQFSTHHEQRVIFLLVLFVAMHCDLFLESSSVIHVIPYMWLPCIFTDDNLLVDPKPLLKRRFTGGNDRDT